MLQRTQHTAGLVTFQSPLLNNTPTSHAFSTRHAGVSPSPFSSLNLDNPNKPNLPDSPTNVRENLARFLHTLNASHKTLIDVSQIHAAHVHLATSTTPPSSRPQADAIITANPDLVLLIRIADCVPILLASSTTPAVAAIHAGWRSIVAGVIPNTIAALHKHFHINPADLFAAIGPAISASHFEVDPDVAQAFAAAGLQSAIHPADNINNNTNTSHPKPHIDLPLAARTQLLARGIPPHHIDTTDRCTFQHAADFFSHRRDHANTGRMAAAITINP